jgi:hypothetical protein
MVSSWRTTNVWQLFAPFSISRTADTVLGVMTSLDQRCCHRDVTRGKFTVNGVPPQPPPPQPFLLNLPATVHETSFTKLTGRRKRLKRRNRRRRLACR